VRVTTAEPAQPKQTHPWRHTALTRALAAVVVLAGLGAAFVALGIRRDQAARRLLCSDDPEKRKQAAWLAVRQNAPNALLDISRRVRERRETDPSVREAYAYALGRSGKAEYFDVLATVVQGDEDAYVRHTAWIAAARVAPHRFPVLAAETPVRDETWDRIGRAAAWLEVGDTRRAGDLLHWAVAGEPEQRQVASLALYRGVAPLLEAVGRWPLQSTIREGEVWPPELAAEVSRRCGALNLQAIADDTRPHLAYAARLRRDVARLTSLRERLAGYLRAL